MFCFPLLHPIPRFRVVCPVELEANDYICRTYYNLLWPPTLVVTLLPAWLAPTDLCNLDPLHPAHLFLPSIIAHTLHITQVAWAHPISATEISSLLSSYANPSFKVLLKTILPEKTSPCTASGLLSKFPLHLSSQLYNLASKCFCTFLQM